jgi:hypothetical protein
MSEVEAQLRKVTRERDQYAYAYEYTRQELERLSARFARLSSLHSDLMAQIVEAQHA